MVTAKELQKAVLDLQTTRPGPGLVKTAVSAALTLPLGYLALSADATWAFMLLGVATGICYASWLITTHDALHHTLTGWSWFDEIVPRLISWPIFWMHGMYSEVHKLHHKMNGDDLADPERVQWTEEEYVRARPLGRFYVRHQWAIDIFIGGGLLLIYETVREALRHYSQSKSMRHQVWLDLVGITAGNAAAYGIAAAHGMVLKYFIFWLLMERIGGGVLQWRAHIEHYGLWGKGRHYFETQAYNCRNLRTNALASLFFNRLNFHSVHHAFARVPFYLLPEAHRRFQALYSGQVTEGPLVEEDGYLRTALRLARQPLLIGPVVAESTVGQRRMVRVDQLRVG